jgi:hypothetical protein
MIELYEFHSFGMSLKLSYRNTFILLLSCILFRCLLCSWSNTPNEAFVVSISTYEGVERLMRKSSNTVDVVLVN